MDYEHETGSFPIALYWLRGGGKLTFDRTGIKVKVEGIVLMAFEDVWIPRILVLTQVYELCRWINSKRYE
jgi:hypothetical protein